MRFIQAKVALMDENQKKVTKSYLVDAETFTEAEAAIAEQLNTTEIKSMSFVSFDEEHLSSKGEYFFKVVSNIITLDEVSAKEIKRRSSALFSGENVPEVTLVAEKILSEATIVSVTKLNIEGIICKIKLF